MSTSNNDDHVSLESMPTEILTTIAVHLSLSSTTTTSSSSSSPTKPTSTSPYLPSNLIPLLLTSKHLSHQLSFTENPRLYSEIFQAKFDTSAIGRRERERSVIHDPGHNEGKVLPGVNAKGMAGELKRRCVALKRLRRAVRDKEVGVVQEEDVWTIYLMLLENDGKNLTHLLDPLPPPPPAPPISLLIPGYTPPTPSSSRTRRSGPLMAFLELYHKSLVEDATEAGLPDVGLIRVLLVWVIWLLTSRDGIEAEDPDVLEEFLFVLRPYVFAAGQFDIFFGPWTYPSLPLHPTIPSSLPSSLPQTTTPVPPKDPYLAELSLTTRSTLIEHYGRLIRIAPPVLSHAAIMNFFSRVDKLSLAVQVMGGNVTQIGMGNQIDPTDERIVVFRPRRSSRYTTYTSVHDSKLHDQDYKRLTRCIDPRSLSGMGIEDWFGRFNGCWEGNFSFFDFDAYRNMLSGEPSALYEGQFGEQSQVWRMREVYIRPAKTEAGAAAAARARPSIRSTPSQISEASSETSSRDRTNASPALNAGFEPSTSAFDNIIPMLPARGRRDGSTTSTTNAVVNLLENDPTDEHLVAMLGGLEGYEMVQPSEVEKIIKRRLEGDENGDPCSDGDDLEIMLIGTGHSAWGEFLIRGRVRLWDGMASLVKEYTPDGRGKWIYRGYIVSGGTFVGRWRDCVTPEEYVGYEGTFTLSQRVDVPR